MVPEGDDSIARGWILVRVHHGRRGVKKRGRSRQSDGEDEENEVCGKLMHRRIGRNWLGS